MFSVSLESPWLGFQHTFLWRMVENDALIIIKDHQRGS